MRQLACLGLAVVGLESEAIGRVAVRSGAMQPWRAARWHAMLWRCGCRHAMCSLVGKFRKFVTPVRPVQEMRAAWLGKHAYVNLNAFTQRDAGPDDQGDVVHAEA